MEMMQAVMQPEQLRRLLIAGKAELNPATALDDLSVSEYISTDGQATILHDQFVAIRIQGIEDRRRKLIDLTLERLDAQQYGICQECEKAISPKRLMAIPWATRCISCQQRISTNADDEERAA